MNITYFIDHLRPDGTQMFLVQLATGLASKGHSQTILCLNDSWDEEVIKKLNSTNSEVRVIGKLSLASGYGVCSLLHHLKYSQIDVVVTFLYVADVVGRVLSKWAGIPRIVTSLRARNVNYSWLQRRLVRATINSADAIVINSASVRTFAIEEEGALVDRIHVIPNGVTVDAFTKPIKQSVLRDKLNLPKTGWICGTVGRLTRQKGIDVLLQAISLMKDASVNLVIFGVGEEEHQLRTVAAKLGLNARVHFVGYRRDLPTLLGALDLYVHPSRFEGMPNAVLEAMAAACPIVATAVDGNQELIEDGKHGWIVPPDNPEELAKAVEKAISDTAEARRRGVLAHERVRAEYSVDSMVDAWETILRGENTCSIRKGSIDRNAG